MKNLGLCKGCFNTALFFCVKVSEAGVHRPHVSGIHGRDSEGAFSIVLAGGYEDDQVSSQLIKYMVSRNGEN